MPFADEAGELRKGRVFLNHPSPRLDNGGKAFFVGILLQQSADGGERFVGLADVDGNVAVGREIIVEVGAAEIDGKAEAEECVGELLSPVVVAGMVLDGQVVSVGVDGIGLVLQFANAVSPDVDFRQVVIHEAADEGEAARVHGVALRLGRANG